MMNQKRGLTDSLSYPTIFKIDYFVFIFAQNIDCVYKLEKRYK